MLELAVGKARAALTLNRPDRVVSILKEYIDYIEGHVIKTNNEIGDCTTLEYFNHKSQNIIEYFENLSTVYENKLEIVEDTIRDIAGHYPFQGIAGHKAKLLDHEPPTIEEFPLIFTDGQLVPRKITVVPLQARAAASNNRQPGVPVSTAAAPLFRFTAPPIRAQNPPALAQGPASTNTAQPLPAKLPAGNAPPINVLKDRGIVKQPLPANTPASNAPPTKVLDLRGIVKQPLPANIPVQGLAAVDAAQPPPTKKTTSITQPIVVPISRSILKRKVAGTAGAANTGLNAGASTSIYIQNPADQRLVVTSKVLLNHLSPNLVDLEQHFNALYNSVSTVGIVQSGVFVSPKLLHKTTWFQAKSAQAVKVQTALPLIVKAVDVTTTKFTIRLKPFLHNFAKNSKTLLNVSEGASMTCPIEHYVIVPLDAIIGRVSIIKTYQAPLYMLMFETLTAHGLPHTAEFFNRTVVVTTDVVVVQAIRTPVPNPPVPSPLSPQNAIEYCQSCNTRKPARMPPLLSLICHKCDSHWCMIDNCGFEAAWHGVRGFQTRHMAARHPQFKTLTGIVRDVSVCGGCLKVRKPATSNTTTYLKCPHCPTEHRERYWCVKFDHCREDFASQVEIVNHLKNDH